MEKLDYCVQGQGHSKGSKCLDDIFSLCQIASAQYLLNSSPIFFFFTKLGMVVYYHEVMCHAEKLVHYLQSHSEGLYYQNITIFCYIF